MLHSRECVDEKVAVVDEFAVLDCGLKSKYGVKYGPSRGPTRVGVVDDFMKVRFDIVVVGNHVCVPSPWHH